LQKETAVTKRKAHIQFNERTIAEFEKEGLKPPSGELGKKERFDKFRAKFNEEKGKLRIIITQMARRPVKIFDEKLDKNITKDFLTYETTYDGRDWLGNPLRVTDTEGTYQKPKFSTTTKINPETGEYITEKNYAGVETIYSIELTDKNRKKVIEDIFNKSNSNPEEILYYYHVPASSRGSSFRCSIFTYDQFINSSMEELENLARATPSPIKHLVKDSKEYHG
jgi:hypothetical protein